MKNTTVCKIQLNPQNKNFILVLIIVFMQGLLYGYHSLYSTYKDSLNKKHHCFNFSYSYLKLSNPELISQKRGNYYEFGYAKKLLPIDKAINYAVGTSIGIKDMQYQLPQPLYFGQIGVFDSKIVIGYLYATTLFLYQKKLKNWDYLQFFFEPKLGISSRIYSQGKTFKEETTINTYTFEPKKPSDFSVTMNYQMNLGLGYACKLRRNRQICFILYLKFLAKDASEKSIPYLKNILPSINLTYNY